MFAAQPWWLAYPVFVVIGSFQWANLGHVLAVGSPLYLDEVLGFVSAPGKAAHFALSFAPISAAVLALLFGLQALALYALRHRLRFTPLQRFVGVSALLFACQPTFLWYSQAPTLFSLWSDHRVRQELLTIDSRPATLPATDPATPPDSVMLILGEALDARFMGLYGHSANSTPELAELKVAGELHGPDHPIVSIGPYTAISHFMLLGLSPDLSFDQVAMAKAPGLFDYARAAGLRVEWHSARSLRWAGMQSVFGGKVDRWSDASHYPEAQPGLLGYVDDALLFDRTLKPLLRSEHPFFAVVQMNGQHLPLTDKAGPFRNDTHLTRYERSVRYTDSLLADLVRSAPANVHIIITSDHGQGYSPEDAQWVPLLSTHPLPDILGHEDLLNWLLGWLGTDFRAHPERRSCNRIWSRPPTGGPVSSVCLDPRQDFKEAD